MPLTFKERKWQWLWLQRFQVICCNDSDSVINSYCEESNCGSCGLREEVSTVGWSLVSENDCCKDLLTLGNRM